MLCTDILNLICWFCELVWLFQRLNCLWQQSRSEIGASIIDAQRLATQSRVPDEMQKSDDMKNHFFRFYVIDCYCRQKWQQKHQLSLFGNYHNENWNFCDEYNWHDRGYLKSLKCQCYKNTEVHCFDMTWLCLIIIRYLSKAAWPSLNGQNDSIVGDLKFKARHWVHFGWAEGD